jgi:multiple sugar transport system ATP-binding protein
VAGFIGSPPMNLVQGTVELGGIRIGSTFLPLTGGLPAAVGATITVGLRPESLELSAPPDGIPARVSIVEELGPEAFIHAQLVNGDGTSSAGDAPVIARVEPRGLPANGELIHLRVKGDSALFFDAGSGDRLGRPGDEAR